MPFPYVSVDEFRDEYGPDHDDFDFADEASYEAFLTRLLEAESERVEADAYADGQWRTDDVPAAVADAVVRLTRLRVDARLSETLSSEQSPSGRQESYRDPREVREAIQDDLADAGFGSGGEASFSIRATEV